MSGGGALIDAIKAKKVKLEEIKEAELGKDHPTVAASLSILALLEGAQGQWQASARHAGEALRVSRHHSVTVLPALSEPEQRRFLAELRSAFDEGRATRRTAGAYLTAHK